MIPATFLDTPFDVPIGELTYVSPLIYSALSGGHVHYAPDYDRWNDKLVPLCGADDGAARVTRFKDFFLQPRRCPTCQAVVAGVGLCLLELLR